MNKQPEISIIIPIYNDELYLEDCLKSILNQSFTDYEVIMIDDGSTDQSSEICDKYCDLDSRFIVKHQNNTGVAQARNNGISLARGKYVMFIDSDDTVEQDFCRIPYEIAELNKAEIVVFCYNYQSKDNECVRGPSDKDIGSKSSEEVLYLLEDIGIFMWNKLYLRQLFSSVRFIPGLICEEHSVQPKLIHMATSIYLSDAVLYNYHIRKDSISSNNNVNLSFANSHYYMVKIKAEDLSEWGFKDLSQMYMVKESLYYLYWFGQYEKYSKESIRVLNEIKARPYFTWKQNKMLFVLRFNTHLFFIICRTIRWLRKQ